jgi:hypothetical protein
MHSKKIFPFLLVAALGFNSLIMPDKAYSQAPPAGTSGSAGIIDLPSSPDFGIIKPVEPVEDEFGPTNFQRLSKLYWAMGKFDVLNDEAINNYLLINECELYQKFYYNDFEWTNIVEATKKSISSTLNTFPTKFEILKPIGLDRYDVEKEVFLLKEDEVFEGARKFEVATNSDTSPVCGKSGVIKDYPRNLIMILNRPINLKEFHVEPELAMMFLDEAARYYDHLPHFLKMSKYERVAFLRLKVSLFQYKETIVGVSGYTRAVVFGRLEGIEIYADPDKMKPLYIKEIKDRRLRRRKSRRDED